MRRKKMYGEISKNWGEFHISSSISSRFIAGGIKIRYPQI
jgi:hypothetical protein